MKYKIGQKVTALGKKCKIVGTKETPYKPKNDYSRRKEIFPEKDYLLFIFIEIKNDFEDYKGILDVTENQIEKEKW
mgnify:CR=1 FL=1